MSLEEDDEKDIKCPCSYGICDECPECQKKSVKK